VVVQLHLHTLPNDKDGQPLSWDNVLHGTGSLGYINSNHQNLEQKSNLYTFSFYKALSESGKTAQQKRAFIRSLTNEKIAELVIAELETTHKNLRNCIDQVDVKVWGHAMVAPSIGLYSNPLFLNIEQQLPNNIRLAHTDFSGMSTFEEAFYQGYNAAINLSST
jgi:maltooligosyltrehalose synthase